MFTLTSAFSQKKKNTIKWDETRPLSWKDYKKKAPKATSFAALTSAAVGFSIHYENEVVAIEIESFFTPKESWTKDKNNQELLAHEILHFSITELFARQLRKQILETNFTSREQKLIKEITKMYSQKMKALAKCQRLYDKETNHSLIKKAQERWIEKVQQELKEVEKYSDTQIVINLSD